MLIWAMLFAGAGTGLFAQQKSYSLFKPAPKGEMREMETDRPDVTETPITLDAGHFQYETSFLDYTKQYTENSRVNTYTINQLSIKLGLSNSTDFQLQLDSYVIERERELGSVITSNSKGIGDMTLRVKQNLSGNDGGDFAIALMPYYKIPTAKYKEGNLTEAGLILPMRLKLPSEWILSTQLEVDRLQADGDTNLHTEFLQSVSISHELFKNMDGLAESYYTYGFKKHEWTNYINAALQYGISANCKVDAGLNYGIQHDAKRSFFVGLAYRL